MPGIWLNFAIICLVDFEKHNYNVLLYYCVYLQVSYVVTNASWSPKYDLRVSSSDRTMEVWYFGMVQQNTGEDWLVIPTRYYNIYCYWCMFFFPAKV